MKVTVQSSRIHGKGVFALENAESGELVGVYEGVITVTEYDHKHVLYLEDEDGRWFGILGSNDLRYLNHSDDPNAVWGTGGPFIYTARPIKAGEELTISYGNEWEPEDD